MSSPSGHAVPFYCPYCGDEEIEPSGEKPGRFACAACTRHFTVGFHGLGPPGGPPA